MYCIIKSNITYISLKMNLKFYTYQPLFKCYKLSMENISVLTAAEDRELFPECTRYSCVYSKLLSLFFSILFLNVPTCTIQMLLCVLCSVLQWKSVSSKWYLITYFNLLIKLSQSLLFSLLTIIRSLTDLDLSLHLPSTAHVVISEQFFEKIDPGK